MKTNARPLPSSLEILEHRIAPAGVVTVDYDPVTATLTVTGDDVSNQISIFSTGPGTNRVQIEETTSLLGGGLFEDVGKISSLNIVGAGGSDTFRLMNLTILSAISFD